MVDPLDLHDSVTQLLFSMTLVAQSIGPTMRKDVSEGEARVGKLLDLAQSARSEMRSLLAELRTLSPAEHPLLDLERLQWDGLAASLNRPIKRSETQQVLVYLEAHNYEKCARDTEEALFRISWEAFSNMLKHAEASHVGVALSAGGDGCRLAIRDNEQGFDTAVQKSGHLGLSTMRERAEALRGTLELTSNQEGTCVSVVVPTSQTR